MATLLTDTDPPNLANKTVFVKANDMKAAAAASESLHKF